MVQVTPLPSPPCAPDQEAPATSPCNLHFTTGKAVSSRKPSPVGAENGFTVSS